MKTVMSILLMAVFMAISLGAQATITSDGWTDAPKHTMTYLDKTPGLHAPIEQEVSHSAVIAMSEGQGVISIAHKETAPASHTGIPEEKSVSLSRWSQDPGSKPGASTETM